MSFYRATSLRFRLMALVVVAVLPVFGLLLFHAYAERERKIHAIEEDAGRMTELAAGSVGKVIEASHQLLMFMAYAEPVRARHAAEARILFEQMLGSGSWENLGLVRSDGAVLASALSVSGPVQLKDRSWFARMQQTCGFAIGEYQVGRITGQPTLNVAFPLPGQPEGAPMDAVFAALKLKTLHDCVSLSQLPPKAVLLVVDRNGTYLARYPGGEQWVGKPSHSWAALQARGGGVGGFVETTGVDGVKRLYHYQAVPGSSDSLFVAMGISKAAIQRETRAELLNSLFWLGLYTLASVIAASLLANRAVLKHVRNLSVVSRSLAAGDLSRRAVVDRGAMEFQELGKSFNDMAEAVSCHREQLEQRVRERTAELRRATATERQSRLMLARVLDSVPQAVFWKDLNSVYLGCNKVFARTVGLDDPAQIVGKTDFDLPWPKQDAEGYVSDDREVMEHNRHKLNYMEQEQCPDGSRRWVNTTKVPLADEDGRIYGVLGVYDDVTERKLAEEYLMESERSLREAQSIAKVGSYTLNIASGLWKSSEVLDEMFGIDKTYDRSLPGWEALIHPEDRLMMADYFQTEVLAHHRPFNQEYRIIRHDDQTVHWVHGMGKLEFDEQGLPVKMHGTIQDITECKQAELDQQQSIAELQKALAQVKTLSGLLPICAGCKQIRDDHGYWSQIESYISQHSDAQFSHGLCPDCAQKYFPEYQDQFDDMPNGIDHAGESPAGDGKEVFP